MALLDLVREVKAGKKKLSDVKPGLQAQVKRLLPVVEAQVKPTKHLTRGVFTARARRARST